MRLMQCLLSKFSLQAIKTHYLVLNQNEVAIPGFSSTPAARRIPAARSGNRYRANASFRRLTPSNTSASPGAANDSRIALGLGYRT
jgi:hypothetical protein